MTLIYFILLLGTIIFIHELGHFLWAKKCGVYCYEFSLGFGPKIFHFRRKNDETEYVLRLIPIGGFVAMAGEEVEDDKKIPKSKKLYNKKWYQKLIIVLAGIINNFLLAIVILFLIAIFNGSYSTKPIVGVVAPNSACEKAGLKKGDKILEINDTKTRTWDDVTLTLTLSNNEKTQDILVLRDGKEKIVKVKPTKLKDKKGNVSYSYGVGMSDKKYYGLGNSIKYATSKFGSMFNSMIVTVKALVTGKVGLNSLSGPVGIYSIVGASSKAGFASLLYLMAYLSLNIGFINLLPFPAFDGYRAFIIIIETITGKKVNPKVDAIINQIGLLFLFGLMIYVTVKDVLRLF